MNCCRIAITALFLSPRIDEDYDVTIEGQTPDL